MTTRKTRNARQIEKSKKIKSSSPEMANPTEDSSIVYLTSSHKNVFLRFIKSMDDFVESK